MRLLNIDERHVMRRALGLDQSMRIYRNRYGSIGRDERWEALVAAGAANRASHGEGETWWYWVTREGFEAVREQGERPDGETLFTTYS